LALQAAGWGGVRRCVIRAVGLSRGAIHRQSGIMLSLQLVSSKAAKANMPSQIRFDKTELPDRPMVNFMGFFSYSILSTDFAIQFAKQKITLDSRKSQGRNIKGRDLRKYMPSR
jgi:hypothetical protein